MSNLKAARCTMLLMFWSLSAANLFAAGRPAPPSEPALEYEISEGQVTLIFLNLKPEDVRELSWGDQSLYGIQWEKAVSLKKAPGFSVKLGADELDLETAPIIRADLVNGERIERTLLSGPLPSLEWLSPEKATCAEAAGIYNAAQCGSTSSSVGTPPYPCCDNNGDGKATGSGDGNCTWYAWYKAKAVKSWKVPSTWSSGSKWCANAAKTAGWKVSSIPTVDTIACSSSIGHVGWVKTVSSDKKTITLFEQNCKVPPSCFGSGTREKSGYTASSFQYISCTDTSKCK